MLGSTESRMPTSFTSMLVETLVPAAVVVPPVVVPVGEKVLVLIKTGNLSPMLTLADLLSRTRILGLASVLASDSCFIKSTMMFGKVKRYEVSPSDLSKAKLIGLGVRL